MIWDLLARGGGIWFRSSVHFNRCMVNREERVKQSSNNNFLLESQTPFSLFNPSKIMTQLKHATTYSI